MSDEAILSVETEIKAVNVKLDELEAAIEGARAAQDKDEVAALRKEKEQLRKDKEQLRAEKLLLLARQPGAPCRVASVNVAPRVHARCSSFVRSFVFWFRAWQSAGGLECAGSSRCEL